MQTKTILSSSHIDTHNYMLTKQEIFNEINLELSLDNNRISYLSQKTKSNYNFIIWLNICALTLATLGGITVYHIFKEQSVRLVAGHTAIRTLETTLLQQLNKQYQLDLASKELEIAKIRENLELAEAELTKTKNQIQTEVDTQLQEQKKILEEKLQKELKGKSIQEQEKIRTTYIEELKRIEEQSKQIALQKTQEFEMQYKQIKEKNEQERLALQQELDKVKKDAHQAQQVQKSKEVKQITPVSSGLSKNQLLDKNIANTFLKIEKLLSSEQFNKIENELRKIQIFYLNAHDTDIILEKKEADFLFVSIVQKYLSMLQNNSESKKSTNSVSQDQSLKILLTELQTLKQLINSNSKRTAQIDNKIKQIQTQTPQITEFADSYAKYSKYGTSNKVNQLIAKADKYMEKQQYREAVNQYQDILRLYPDTPEQNRILNSLYEAIKLEFQKQGNNIPVNNSEKLSKIQQTAKNLLKNSDSQNTNIKIVYMQTPSGYIADISRDTAIVSLTPGLYIKKNTVLHVFRIAPGNNLQLNKIGTATVKHSERKGILTISIKDKDFRIGDLIYIFID
ncbi:MAG: hypothetical protein ACRCTQ_07200 [Brevinemataceae bacterium]